jgi:glyoxylase-like metal-dependent hydrolase (beta-lactamase superfamily II)
MSADTERDVDHLIDTRPGKELLTHNYDDPAVAVHDRIFRSAGSTASYLLAHDDGRIIINTGMGYEAVHHKRVFDAVHAGPTTHIFTTQAHVDHVGGVAHFREPGTVYVAQANNRACQADDAQIQRLRMMTAQIWFDVTGANAKRIAAENPGVKMRQDSPTPDITFDRRLGLHVGGVDVELIAAVGETIDSMIVWLPQTRTAVISNLLGPLFPHFPNFNTLRGDRYRFVEPYLQTIRMLRELHPEMLVTGRHLPIIGTDLIDASLARLHGAVDHVHRETLAGMNEGKDIATLMREVTLPAHLRVGQGYGKVAWGVRTIWESYMGWFQLRSTTELYPVRPGSAIEQLVTMIGSDAVAERAAQLVVDGRPVEAIHLAEAVLAIDAEHRGAADVMVSAHDVLLASGGDVSFWESGWLRHQRDRWAT